MASKSVIEEPNVSGLSGRYATALFDLASGASILDQVANDLRQIEQMIVASDDLKRMMLLT